MVPIKKTIYLAAAILALAALMCACKQPEEYGSIGEVEIATSESTDEKASIFEEQPSPFDDYEYADVDFEPAKMTFKVPKTWKQKVLNQSCIRYDAPSNDPHLPGVTCYIKCLYDYNAEQDELNPYAHMATEFGKLFTPYITGLPYSFDGGSGTIKSFSVADNVEDITFCGDDTAACLKETKDIVLIDRKTSDTLSVSGTDLTAGYFRWENFPVMISFVTPVVHTQNAKEMTKYIMSTVSYIPQKAAHTKSYTFSNMSVTVPEEFSPAGNTDSILISNPKSLVSTAGMSVCVFKAGEDLDTLTDVYVQNSYADKLASVLLDPSCAGNYTVLPSVTEDTSGKKLLDEDKLFYGTVDILSNEEASVCAPMTYGKAAVWPIDIFFVTRGNTRYVLAAMYPPQDSTMAYSIEKTMLQTLSKAH